MVLFQATEYCQYNTVKILIKYRVNVNAEDVEWIIFFY